VKTFLSGAARGVGFFVGFFGCLAAFTAPASAQGLLLLRDTETERALRSYEDPLLRAGGVDPAGVHIYLVNDPTVNSFVAEGQNMFIQTGMIMFAKNALELKGVMAHETGHIVAGHLSRDTAAIVVSANGLPMRARTGSMRGTNGGTRCADDRSGRPCCPAGKGTAG